MAKRADPVDINHLGHLPNAARRRLFDLYACVDSSDLTEAEIDELRPLVFEALAGDCEPPFFIKVHDRFRRSSSGRPLFPLEVSRGVVYIVRNPLDIACSYAAHRGDTIDDSIEAMSDRDHSLAAPPGGIRHQLIQRLGSWSEHVESWLHGPIRPLWLVRYEDMACRARETFWEVAEATGLVFDEARLERALSHSRFSVVQMQEEATGFREGSVSAPRFFRRGVVGGWRDELRTDQVDRLVRDHRRLMSRLGYLDKEGVPT